MTKKFKTNVSIFMVFTFWIIAIASNPSKKTFKNADKWIPDDFNPSKTILLVQKFTISENAESKMEEYMSEKYPYKYEFVSLQTIRSKEGKYSNTSLYKYALIITSHTTTSRDMQTGKPGPTVTGFDYNFYNRENDKNYPATNKSSSYAIMTFKPVINSIVKKYE